MTVKQVQSSLKYFVPPFERSRGGRPAGTARRSQGPVASKAAQRPRRPAVRQAFLLLCAASAPLVYGQTSTQEISVVTPEGPLEAGEDFEVQWSYSESGGTTGDLNSFTIDLHYCSDDGSDCTGGSSCGEELTALCVHEDGVCVDSDGTYDVQIPTDTPAGKYSVQVALAEDPTVVSCSQAFDVSESSGSSGAEGEPSLEVLDTALFLVLGGAFTAEWNYDDGNGTAEGTFQINLNKCSNSTGSSSSSSSSSSSGSCSGGGCGIFVSSLCGDSGCYDPGTGDYDVVIPEDVSSGSYKIEVVNSESGLSACTASTASIVGEDFDIPTPAPTPAPTHAPTVPPTPAPSTPNPTVAPVSPSSAPLSPSPAPVSPSPAPVSPSSAPVSPSFAPVSPSSAPVSPSSAPVSPSSAPVSPSSAPVSSSSASAPPSPAPVAPTPAPVAPTPATEPPSAPTSSSSDTSSSATPGTPPTPVPAKVECDSSAELEYVYSEESTKLPLVTVSHASGDRSEAGCLTLTMLYEWLGDAPGTVPGDLLYTVDPSTDVEDTSLDTTPTGTWLLRTNLVVTNGVTLQIKGTSVEGGDCDELKIYSTVKQYHRVAGHGGNLDIESTLIRSWDTKKDKEHIFKESTDGSDPRSYIACISEVADPDETCDGVAQDDMGECRMDIVDSELGYLGWDDTESYGVTWKVRGLCEDLSNKDTLFDNVRVYGDMTGSNIHHMWYGMYSYGHLGGVWTNNEMHNNHVYGFDPHDDSDYLTISDNVVYNNGNHGIIASKRCDHLLVEDNLVYGNSGSGIMLHKSCDDSIVSGNEVRGSFDAGISLVETSRCEVTNNNFTDNRWGFRVILGSTDNVFDGNVVNANRYSDIYSYYGAEEEVPEVAPYTGTNVNNIYRNNVVTHIVDTVVDIEDSEGTEISSNTFYGEDGYFVFWRSNNTHVVDNIGDAADGSMDDITDSCFTEESDRLPVCT